MLMSPVHHPSVREDGGKSVMDRKDHAKIRSFSRLSKSLFASTGSAFAARTLPTAPASPITVGFATTSTMRINGESGTQAVVASGSSVWLTTTVSDNHRYCPSCFDNVPMSFIGQSSPLGCLENICFTGRTQTDIVTVTAPTEPGIYNILATSMFTCYCSQDWNGGSGGTTIATLIVTGSSAQLCSLITSWSTDPDVAAGLRDKLAAAQAADDAGRMNVVTHVMRAFNNVPSTISSGPGAARRWPPTR